MNVLIACEFSGVVRDAFLAAGHRAWSCDLLPSERKGPHLQDDIRDVLRRGWFNWDMLIAFPPCTHLAVSGARWFAGRRREQRDAIDFARMLMDSPVPKIAVENPVGVLSTDMPLAQGTARTQPDTNRCRPQTPRASRITGSRSLERTVTHASRHRRRDGCAMGGRMSKPFRQLWRRPKPSQKAIKAAQVMFAPKGHWEPDPNSLTPKWIPDTVTKRTTLKPPNRRKHARPKR